MPPYLHKFNIKAPIKEIKDEDLVNLVWALTCQFPPSGQRGSGGLSYGRQPGRQQEPEDALNGLLEWTWDPKNVYL